jgi:ribose 1,5-bisphosphokinase
MRLGSEWSMEHEHDRAHGGGAGGRAPIAGTLALVVGPSGSGKDTLIGMARTALAGDDRFVFARRVVTRDSDNASESHDTMAPDTFARAETCGRFLLAWRAHGLGYGIPAEAGMQVRRGQVLIANASRTVVMTAASLAARTAVLHVTAPADVLAQRIAARGRETASAVAARLARQPPLATGEARVFEIVNDGPLERAAEEFTAALRALAGP